MHNPKTSERRLSKSLLSDLLLVGQLVLVCAALRLLCQDLPNVAPIAAMALFAGLWVQHRALAFAAPIGAMFVSDRLIDGGTYEPILMLIVYTSLSIPVFFAPWLRRLASRIWNEHEHTAADSLQRFSRAIRAVVIGVLGFTFVISGSLFFFLASNLGVWWYWYERDLAGLTSCFAAALPFFRYTLMGDFAFATLFASVHCLAYAAARGRVQATALAENAR